MIDVKTEASNNELKSWLSFFLPSKEQRLKLKLNHIIAAKTAIYEWLEQQS